MALCHPSPKCAAAYRAAGLLALRLAIGVPLALHGWQKFTMPPAKFAGFLGMLNVPMPEVMAWVVTIVELVGGIALILGVGTRIAGALITVNMLVASFLVHWPKGGYSGQGGAEYTMTLAFGALALALCGAGRWALEALFCKGCKEEYCASPEEKTAAAK